MSIQTLYPAISPSLSLDFAKVKALDPRITFTRASTATYYDGKTVAKAEENLLLQSEFASGWINEATNTLTANNAAAPNGTTTAALLSSPAATNYAYQVPTTTIGLQYVFSFFVKNSTATVSHYHVRTSITVAVGTLTWSGATLSSVIATAGTVSFVAVGNDWYRVSAVYTASETAARHRIGGGDIVSTTGNILVWGAQLEQRSAVTAYTPTTTQPITNYIPQLLTAASGVARFDHNPTTFESLGLEIEEQRTNLLLYSEQFDNAAWTTSNISLQSNVVVAPNGSLAAYRLTEGSTDSNFIIRTTSSVPLVNNAVHSCSVYAKEDPTSAKRYLQIYFNAGFPSAGGSQGANFDLGSGTVTLVVGLSGWSASITPVGNGWYRCTVVTNAASSTSGGLRFAVKNAPNLSMATNNQGDGYSGIYIWGAQLEAGAFATSYIPTVASQVTRSADVAVMTGTNFSNWYNQSEGTFFSSVVLAQPPALKSSASIYAASDNTVSNRILVLCGTGAGGNINALVTTGGVAQAQTINGGLSTAGAYLYANAYKVNDFASVVNGGAAVTDISGTVPVVDRLYFGALANGSPNLNSHISRIAYYPLRVTNAQLQALTIV
jgi:hypothetical protein